MFWRCCTRGTLDKPLRFQVRYVSVNIQKIQDDVLKLWNAVKSHPGISEDQKNRINLKALYEGVVRSPHRRQNPDPDL